MTKRDTILRAIFIGLIVAVVTVFADGVLSRTHLTWLAWVVDVGAILLLTLGAWGMFGASSPLFGGVVDGRRIRRDVVALTFDDGPSPDTTPRILDILRADGNVLHIRLARGAGIAGRAIDDFDIPRLRALPREGVFPGARPDDQDSHGGSVWRTDSREYGLTRDISLTSLAFWA